MSAVILKTDRKKKLECSKLVDRNAVKCVVVIAFRRSFGFLKCVLPILVVFMDLSLYRRTGQQIHTIEWISMLIEFMAVLGLCGFGGWLFGHLEKNECKGTIYQRDKETIIFRSFYELSYEYQEFGKKKEYQIKIKRFSIKEESNTVEFYGICPNSECQECTLSLIDYYEPGLINTLKTIREDSTVE